MTNEGLAEMLERYSQHRVVMDPAGLALAAQRIRAAERLADAADDIRHDTCCNELIRDNACDCGVLELRAALKAFRGES
jgi:hypothetical protein